MAKQSNSRRTKAICSFCGRTGSQADTLIEGPNKVFICPECVELGGPRRTVWGLTTCPGRERSRNTSTSM